VYALKRDPDSFPARFKARWVARRFTQRYGIDYNNTYTLVKKLATINVMLTLIARLNTECKQYDLITAFPNALN
jgi:hypothetical protein